MSKYKAVQNKINKIIIPSVRKLKDLEYALQCKSPFILLSEIHIGNLKEFTSLCHTKDKLVLVNIDLVGGLSKDSTGIKFLKTLYKVDGIMSPNPIFINMAKDLEMICIHRFFMIDSKSFESGMKALENSNCDAVEILPSPMAADYFQVIKEQKNVPILAGGFIKSVQMIKELFELGIDGVTTSNKNFW
ncbi:MAG: glycerol-3-phosphate responsive antiterminator [Thermosediminibacteraceae bacterium]|nr:glycerol-3-phosphate responsive antiterminator [Thermosediminibacteraceae bacterium]